MKPLGILFLLNLACTATLPKAFASQTAVINVRAAYLYEKPDRGSGVLTEVFEGESIEVSSQPFTNGFGELWYKAKSRSKTTGFIPSNDIMTEEFAEAEMKRGHDPYSKRRSPEAEADPRWTSIWITQLAWSWSFLPRDPVTGITSSVFGIGGQSEWLSNLRQSRPGFEGRRWGLGAGMLMTSQRRALFLSGAGRTFLENSFAEPEFRLRLGRDFLTGQYIWGAALGYRKPFSSHSTAAAVPHWGWDAELGVWSLLSAADDAFQFGFAIGIHRSFE
ncbi:MAG: SH3 domain-containing protein [Bdellovibrionales bacterium]|nr:SH3 domain-containing protein [Bdellovibrionales bacterium]